MTQSMGAEELVRLDVDVVLDPASLGYALGAIVPAGAHEGHNGYNRRLVKPSLVGLVGMLRRRGLMVRHLTVVVPTVPVRLARTSEPTMARTRTKEWSEWIDAEASELRRETKCDLRILRGAFDGMREVGVDELVAWAALDVGTRSGNGASEDRPVVVVSADSDMWDLWRWGAPQRIFVAAQFDSDQRKKLRDANVPFIFLDPRGLITVVPGQLPMEVDVPEVVVLTDDHPHCGNWDKARAGDLVLSSPEPADRTVLNGKWSTVLNRCGETAPPPRKHFTEVGTIAVVDPYGMRNQALRAIGVAHLPRADTVRSVLGELRFPDPVAVHCVIPDLTSDQGFGDLPKLLREAWTSRDAQLDRLADELGHDEDETTHSRRAEVRAERMAKLLRKRAEPDHHAGDTDPAILRAQDEWRVTADAMIKRLSTNLIAELWNAVHHGVDTSVALVSEDPDVYWALAQLRTHDPRLRRVTRIGLHARRVVPLANRDQVDPTPFVVLTEWLTAELCGVTDHRFARTHREGLAHAVHGGDNWQVVGLDPESGGIVIRQASLGVEGETSGESAPEVSGDQTDVAIPVALESLLHPGAVAISDDLTALLRDIDSGEVRFDLLFDPDRTCSVPQLRLTDAAPGEDGAVVIARDGDHLHVDVDGDGDPDGVVAIGHDTTSHPPGERIALRQLHGNPLRWVLEDPGPDPIAVASHGLEVVDLTAVKADDGSEIVVTADGSKAHLLAVPGWIGVQESGRVLASRLPQPESGTSVLLALSSVLDHLGTAITHGESTVEFDNS